MRLFLFFLLFSITLQAQNEQSGPINLQPTTQNYIRAMAIENPSSRQVDTLIQLSISYSFTNEDTSVILGERSVEISKGHEDQAIHAKALLELGDTYRIFGNVPKGETLILEGKAIYETLGDEGQVAYADNKLGAVAVNKAEYDQAVKYYLSALEIWEKLKDSSNLTNPYINLGDAFWRLGQPDKAEEYTNKALQIAEELKQDRPRMFALNNQGLNFKALAESYSYIADTMSQDAQLYKDSVDLFYDKALQNFEKAYGLAQKLNNKQSAMRHLINMATIKDAKAEYPEALKLTKEAEVLSNNLGDVSIIVLIKRNLTSLYRQTGQMAQAIAYGEEAVKLAQDNNFPGYVAGVSDQLYQAYKQTGQFDKALKNLEQYKSYQVNTLDTEKVKAIAEIEEKYQTVQKEKQILEQQNEILELEKTNSRIARQRNLYTGSAGILVLLGFLGFQINRIRRERNDKKAFAEALIYAQEEDRKRIARDLHDGVGQSLLLIKKQLEASHATSMENQRMITDTLEEVRSISRDLHPFQLEKFGLTTTINDMIEKVSHASDIFITKEIDPVDGLLSEKAEINVFRTVQEALSNIVKHAEASAAKVTIRQEAGGISLKIQDNGKGFDHELAVVKSKSLGLRTMYERISSIGGKLKIEKGASKGTVIEIQIPAKNKSN
jgi:signal transduction histidine kinase